jgi:AcrR family transcriptional regulator
MPKIVDHDEYRKEILGKCFGLFSRKGYANVTMREIASEIGVSTGTLYHYFSTKEEILEQLFPFAAENNIGDYFQRSSGDLTAGEKLERISKFWLESEQLYKALMLLAIDLFRNNTGNSEQIFFAFAQRYTNAISEILDISGELSKMIFIYLLGLVFHSVLTPHGISYRDEIDFLRQLLQSVIEEEGSEEKEILIGKLKKI